MPEKKNFLIFAIGLGAAGIIIGSITIGIMVSDLMQP